MNDSPHTLLNAKLDGPTRHSPEEEKMQGKALLEKVLEYATKAIPKGLDPMKLRYLVSLLDDFIEHVNKCPNNKPEFVDKIFLMEISKLTDSLGFMFPPIKLSKILPSKENGNIKAGCICFYGPGNPGPAYSGVYPYYTIGQDSIKKYIDLPMLKRKRGFNS